MMIKEEEKSKVNSSQIKNFDKILDKIDIKKQLLIDDFDLNASRILGNDLIEKLFDFFGDSLSNKISRRIINTNKGKVEVPYSGFLTSIHKSEIKDSQLREEYESRIASWFNTKTLELKKELNSRSTFDDVNKCLPSAYALASLAITSFHKLPNMILHDVQIIASIALCNGDIAELATGEGKTLSAVLPAYLHALRGKGVHIITANSYLSKRDFEEICPILNGLGITCGFVPDNIFDLATMYGISMDNISYNKKLELEKKLSSIKKNAYLSDVTYGSKSAIAFDYLRDGIATNKEELLQRDENTGLAIIDEVDDVLIDDAQCPYVLAGNYPIYFNNMNLLDLAMTLNVPYTLLEQKLQQSGMNFDLSKPIDFETARNISYGFFSKEILPDQITYQKRAQKFFEQKILPNMYIIKENNEFGVNPNKLYEILTSSEDDYDFSSYAKNIRDESYIIYYPEGKKYQITDKCYDDFLNYCYAAFRANTVANDNKDSILSDSSYIVGRDYNIVGDGIILTLSGVQRIIQDNNHRDFVNDYNSYMKFVFPLSTALIHYLNQAVIANLKMNILTDYVVDNGVVKLVKNGRIQEGTSYTDGLQQAIELKEKIPFENISRENQTIASITQKDFYSRYDIYSGMTGTSSKEIFRKVFGKETVSIPRNAFYEFYNSRSKRKRKIISQPIGVEKKDTVFAVNQLDKINLIIQSIQKSLFNDPMQPVLLVVSNPTEIKLLSDSLNNAGITHYLLDATTDKSKEAEIIAKAGLPGAVTISTEMAGRGTDIKIGGDRQTIIDIATERHIRQVEKKFGKIINLSKYEREKVRNSVEKALMNYRTLDGNTILWSSDDETLNRNKLRTVGLKVISSGFFNISRIDRQLEGRTGRNGISGICERYACPSDLEYLGIKEVEPNHTVTEYFRKYTKNNDGSLEIDKNSLRKIKEKIRTIQFNNEEVISNNIMETQQIDKTATDIIEKYRKERRKILEGNIDIDLEFQKMLEDTIDNILLSYLTPQTIDKEMLLEEISIKDTDINFETFLLEVKEVLGINIDLSSVFESNANLLEFRNALINYMETLYNEQKKENPKSYNDRVISSLLTANSYIISNMTSVLSRTTSQKRLNNMAPGMENMVDTSANIDFYDSYQAMKLEAEKNAVRQLMGAQLTVDERKKMEQGKHALFEANTIESNDLSNEYNVVEPSKSENDGNMLQKFRQVKASIDKQSEKELKTVLKKSSKMLEKGNLDIRNIYSNLSVRYLTFEESLKSSKNLILVPVNPLTIFARETLTHNKMF